MTLDYTHITESLDTITRISADLVHQECVFVQQIK